MTACTRWFNNALSDSMFTGPVRLRRSPMDLDAARQWLQSAPFSCGLNASHVATVDALSRRLGIAFEPPSRPPRITLGRGDALLVVTLRDLPRLTENRHYTEAEIAGATFEFALWTVEDGA